MEIRLKYGCNPNQRVARVRFEGGGDGPLRVIHGEPSYINVLDALRGWQLVRELRASVGKPAAASFKHVSPAGAAVASPLDETFRRAHLIDTPDLSPVAQAYAKARSSDRSASFGDFIAVSEVVDESLARLIKPEVSDGIIAPGYELAAAELLRSKKGGKYVMFEVDPGYEPPAMEDRLEFGLRLEQSRNDAVIDRGLLANVVTDKRELPGDAAESLLVASITLKHTQSNSVAVAVGGQAVGIGAGQQSRIACTRLACDKYDRWLLKSHPATLALAFKADLPRAEKVNVVDQFVRWDELGDPERRELVDRLDAPPTPITLDQRLEWAAQHRDAALGSDAFFPFRDNLDRAARSGVGYVIQAGGSKRDQDVIAAANEHQMVMVMSGLRLFLH